MTSTQFCFAELQTKNFTFQAIGSTEAEVTLTLKKVFEKHIKKTDGWLTWQDVAEDVYVRCLSTTAGWVA
jgi:hypothetical protein